MDQRRLGKSSLTTSAVGFGLQSRGGQYARCPCERSWRADEARRNESVMVLLVGFAGNPLASQLIRSVAS